MPKIIEDIESIILAEAKRQLMSEGYSGMTLRSVASGCDIAVGTIYNHFKSKDNLIASFMLDDWLDTLESMKRGCSAAKQPCDVFACIYRGIVDYSDKYAKLFDDSEAKRSSGGVFPTRHSMLRSQIMSLIDKTCRENALHYTDYLSEFIAEAILNYASKRKDFSALSEILIQLFKPVQCIALPII